MKKYYLFFVYGLLSMVCCLPVHSAEVLERILAVVNDEIVTEQDLEVVMAPVVAQYRTSFTGAEYDQKIQEARQEFLTKVIDDKLILSEAKRKQVILKDQEVDEMMTEVRNKFPSREAFVAAIEGQGLSEKKLWNRFHDQLMTQKLVAYEVKSKVSVSPGEVNEYYKKHSQDFMQGEKVELQHILIRISTHTEEEARQMASKIASEAKSGVAFEELAKTYSEGAEAKEGGKMGWVEKGQLMGEIDEKVFMLEPGQITEPIMSSLGFHIFKVLDKTSLSIKPLSEVRGDIQDRIFREKLRERLEAWMQSLKKNAYISIR